MSGVAWWSQTAASNSTQDPSVQWPEGMAPSQVNDSARAEMASVAKWRDDIAGATVTAGTSTAFTLTTYQSFDTLARLNGQVVAFTPHTTNTAGSPNITLNVDGLGAKTIQLNPGVDVPAGYLVSGSPYVVLYNALNGVFYLQNSFGNPYNVPIGGFMPYAGSTAPNSSFVLAYGQAISRSTYAALFSLVGTTYGSGDGTTTFNVPDLRGRVIAGKDDMGGSSANRLTAADDGLNGDTLGATGGGETQSLVTANLPAYTPSGTVSVAQAFFWYNQTSVQANAGINVTTSINTSGSGTAVTLGAQSAPFTGTAQGGTSAAFGIVQPTIILNFLMRII
ncbi:microcystin-dependent protein [Bradyrhizobium ottawaense]|uniref:phage tail protein n=1 Tax=Bradyrhizobium ottawaense TaxID=931866 RepID=UPI0035138FDA